MLQIAWRAPYLQTLAADMAIAGELDAFVAPRHATVRCKPGIAWRHCWCFAAAPAAGLP